MVIDPVRVKEVFLEAADLPDEATRASYLDGACGGDAGLRERVEALLRSHDPDDSFLGTPAAVVPDPDRAGTLEFAANTERETNPTSTAEALSFLAPPGRPGSLGRIGHYEMLQVLGHGGFGVVFRASDEILQRVVAVKVMAPQIAATSPARKRFLREARSSAQVRHENVVQVYEVGEQPLPYLVMEFIPGESLQQKLDRTGPLEVSEVLRIGRQIAEGLAAAHACDLIHRDIKPGNILLEGGAQKAKITDFGLARAADDASISQSGILAGTPMYMSPEQALGHPIDRRADLFSLGSVLYQMVSGRPPFRAPTALAVLKRVAEETPRPIPEIIPETPAWLCGIITKLHAKNPADRFQSAREVADLLAQHLAHLQYPGSVQSPQAAAPAAPSREILAAAPALRPRFRSRRWAVATVLLMLLGGLGFTEATGVTDLRGTVIRLFSPEGTLVVEVDDPGVSVEVDGSDLVIPRAGAREIRLKPGNYTVEARKDGKVVRRELVTVTKNGRHVVRVEAKTAKGADDAVAAWERAVALLPAAQQVKFVVARMQELNPSYDGKVEFTIEKGVVTELVFSTEQVSDISPVRVFTNLRRLQCIPSSGKKGKLIDLAPLRGLPLTHLFFGDNPVGDLSPLEGMKLITLHCPSTKVADLAPLQGMPLEKLDCGFTRVADLSPLKGMKLREADFQVTNVADFSPLQGMPLKVLVCHGLRVPDLSPLKGMPLEYLNCNACTLVSDLSPLKGMPLSTLGISGTNVTDLAPLKGMITLKDLAITNTGRLTDLSPLMGMQLEHIMLTPKNITQGLDILRDMKSLNTIVYNQAWPAAEFWERYDKGEFKQ
jgi:hypothetical protein